MIFDESADFPGPDESHFAEAFADGLWAKSDPMLSMAAYPKVPLGADSAFVNPMLAVRDNALGQPAYIGSPFAHSVDGHGSPDAHGFPYVAPNGYTKPFESQSSLLEDSSTMEVPEIISVTPQTGSEGKEVVVRVSSQYDITSVARACFLSFRSAQVQCAVNLVSLQNGAFTFTLSCNVPAFAQTMSTSFEVPLTVIIDVPSNGGPLVLPAGIFTYEQLEQPNTVGDVRKRRMSNLAENTSLRPAKRHSAHEMTVNADSEMAVPMTERSASFSAFMPTPSTTASFPVQQKLDSSAVTSSAAEAQAPSLTPSWSASTSPATSPAPALSVSPKPQNPTLIRTSTMQLNQSNSFNPYAMYPTKAVLELNGDLDAMAKDWTDEEKAAKRRLVQFTRAQEGSTIYADFKAVTPEERAPNSICISCIYWDEKDECFVTSVDTIYLLESLVGVRFTVEEKNRIRRNLEGFRPLTVSKAKPESEEFFKVIMGFPAPKPRNIEKDVKVFPWKILSHALKKIIGKYSASYSSTASALPTMTAPQAEGASFDLQRGSSPQSLPESTTLPTPTFPLDMPATTYSSEMPNGLPNGSSVDLAPAVSTYQPVSTMATTVGFEPAYTTSAMMNGGFSWDSDGTSNAPEFDYMSTIPYTMG